MKLRLQLTTIFRTLRRSGSRGWLALGAVALGIASMMIMLALAAGAEREMQAITDQLGKNLFAIRPARVDAPLGRGRSWYLSTRLTLADAQLLAGEVPDITTIAPVVEGPLTARFADVAFATTVRGVTPDFVVVRNFTLGEGRLLDNGDGASRERVCVLGSFVATQLNAGVGDTIWIGNAPFEVVGLLEEKGTADGQNEDDQILVPLETAARRLFNIDNVSRLLVQVRERELIPVVQQRTSEVLRASHKLKAEAKDDFEMLSLIRANEIRRINSQFLGGLAQIFAFVTLAVGGAGVLVVTYLNVKERTSEIGLRMAVGARARDIAMLFVSEACALSGAGGVAGLVAGSITVLILHRVLGWSMAVEPRGVVTSFLTSMLLGMIFSVAPALRAAHVTPVEALRDR